MKLLKWICCALIALCTGMPSLQAQKAAVLQLNYDCDTPGIAFAKVSVIDKRMDGTLIGYAQRGTFNRQTPITFEGSLADSIAPFFRQPRARVHADKELVLLLEEFFMSELTQSMSELGKVKISVRLFTGDKQGYTELLTVDSTFVCRGKPDVTEELLRKASACWCMISNMAEKPAAAGKPVYTQADLSVLDSIEASAIPIFNQAPAPGLFYSYNALRDNKSDKPCKLVFKEKENGEVIVFQVWEKPSGKTQKFRMTLTDNVYAVSDGQQLARQFNGKFYMLEKTARGLFFYSPADFNSGANPAAGAGLGLVGGLTFGAMYGHKKILKYQLRINPRNGRAVPARIITED